MAKLYTVFNLDNGHMQLPSGGFLSPAGSPNGKDRSYPVEIPEGHVLWRLANPPPEEGVPHKPLVKIVEGDATAVGLEKPKAPPAPPAPKAPPAPVSIADKLAKAAKESLQPRTLASVPDPVPAPAKEPAKVETKEVAPAPVVAEKPADASAASTPDDDMAGVLEGLGKDVSSDEEESSQSRSSKKKGRK